MGTPCHPGHRRGCSGRLEARDQSRGCRLPTAAVARDPGSYDRAVEHTPPDLYQPRLSRWGHAWRAVVMLLICVVTSLSPLPVAWRDSHWLVATDLTLGAASFVLVWFRRRHPMAVATLITLAGFLSSTASGPGTLAAVSLATRRVWWQLAAIGLLNVAASFTYNLIVPTPDNGPWWVELVVVVVVTVAVLGWGAYIGSRRELIWTFRNRAERAEAEQELRAAQARANERARIA